MSDKIPALNDKMAPPLVLGASALAAELASGLSVAEIAAKLSGPFASEADMIGTAFDTSVLAFLSARRDLGLALQQDVLEQGRLFRVLPSLPANSPRCGFGLRRLRLLGFVAEGDLQTNMPIEFITAHLPVRLDLLYVALGDALPAELPDHDLAICLVSDTRPDILRQLACQLTGWPRPVLNHPAQALGGRVEQLSRDGIAALFGGSASVLAPPTCTLDRGTIIAAANLEDILPGANWPILIRPEGAHAGRLLELLSSAEELAVYVESLSAARFTVSQFVDYRDADGFYRKRRVALIDGEPFLCHMAISSNWMIHYVNAGMLGSAAKRAEEAAAMVAFDTGFAARHRAGLAEISAGLGLDYVLLDCAEAPDGRLLLFEVEMAAIIHALDPVDLFAYKQPQMQDVFAAFGLMLERNAVALVT